MYSVPSQPPYHPRTSGMMSMPSSRSSESLMDVDATWVEAVSPKADRMSYEMLNVLPNIGECRVPLSPQTTAINFSPEDRQKIAIFTDETLDPKQRIRARRDIETLLVESATCDRLNPQISLQNKTFMSSIGGKELSAMLDTIESMDASIHDNIACMVQAVTYRGKMPDMNAASMRERVRNWFTDPTIIGKPSVEGFVLKTRFNSSSDLFVLKVPRQAKDDELIHEALVGLFAMNKLRRILPNYMYVYGIAKCSPPFMEGKVPATWCSSTNPPTTYLISENIKNSIAFSDWIQRPDSTGLQLTAIMLQIINALNVAYKSYGYCHYDLHGGNILIRQYEQNIAIPFFGTEMYDIGHIATNLVPVIIDYGYSRVKVGGVSFGKIGLETFNVNNNRAFPYSDLYKIIGFIGRNLVRNENPNRAELGAVLEKFFSVFEEGSLAARVQERIRQETLALSGFTMTDYFEIDKKYAKYTHDDYLKRLVTTGIDFPVFANIKDLETRGIYAAPRNSSMDVCMFYDMFSNGSGPKTSLEYCEAIDAVRISDNNEEYKYEILQWISSKFDPEKYFQENYVNADKGFIAEMRTWYANTVNVDKTLIPDLNTYPQVVYNFSDVEKYASIVSALIVIKEFVALYVSFIKSSICSLQYVKKLDSYVDIINDMIATIEPFQKLVEDNRAALKNNAKILSSMPLASYIARNNGNPAESDWIFNYWTKIHAAAVDAL